MLLAAMLAMVLVAAAPALAQATAVQYDSGDEDNSVNTEICTNVADASASQVQYGDANAASVEGDAAAEISQELGISQEQVNQCFNQLGIVPVVEAPEAPEGEAPEAPAPEAPAEAPEVVVDETPAGEEVEKVVVEDVPEVVAVVSDGQDDDADGAVDEVDEIAVVINATAEATATAIANAEAVVTNAVDDDADGTVDEVDEVAVVVVDDEAEAVVAEVEAADAAEVTELPDTGGASLFTLGAGALLVGGGLLARRIFS